MKISNLYDEQKYRLFDTDENGREINIYTLLNAIPNGESLYYPNTLLASYQNTPKLIRPIDEKIMSLEKVGKLDEYKGEIKLFNLKYVEENPVFFFIYNTDNYFHFIYDTLPYLISFFKLKETTPNLKLLMNYPNSGKDSHYKFVIELLSTLGITENDIIIINDETIYEKIFISDSYTHGIDSNLPPRLEIHTLYKEIVDKVKDHKDYPKKIYISRRSWIHGDTSNMGTNYTTRRKMVNEDALVDLLESNGYTEVFTETMNTVEKINLFNNAESIIGPIGGGLVNVLFSKKECELISIMSPEFFNVNKRFIFSINNVYLKLFEDVEHVEKTDIKLYMRVKVGDVVGEVIEINDEMVKIAYNDTSVAGWNSEVTYNIKEVRGVDCVKLDNGLNSSWKMDIDKFKKNYLC